ncbi:MAG: hypothetical protein GF316_18635 [Candidatus Lokiarchaeota archaeon]|nr:hypothetical protein [Candidatus Lokiarchaeota archaeon]
MKFSPGKLLLFIFVMLLLIIIPYSIFGSGTNIAFNVAIITIFFFISWCLIASIDIIKSSSEVQNKSEPRKKAKFENKSLELLNPELQNNPNNINQSDQTEIFKLVEREEMGKNEFMEDIQRNIKIISITREYEFIGGQIRFKIGLENNTKYSVTSLKITLDLPKALKWILHEPDYERKSDIILIPKLGSREKITVSFYLEPINCVKSTINAIISFYDFKERPHALPMKPKTISITCPIFFTETQANFARVRNIHRKLPHHDRKIFPVIKEENSKAFFKSLLSVLNLYDIKLIRETYSDEDNFGEAWFYGITKVKKNQLVMYVLLDGKNRILEFEVSGTNEEQITAFLAEISNKIRMELLHRGLLTEDDQFYDLRVTILSNLCPYCYNSLSEKEVRDFQEERSLICPSCNVKLNI